MREGFRGLGSVGEGSVGGFRKGGSLTRFNERDSVTLRVRVQGPGSILIHHGPPSLLWLSDLGSGP